MSQQQSLFEVEAIPRPLTDRQATALQHLKDAGREGLSGAELGKLMGSGPRYAKSDGLGLLRALKAKGHALQGARGMWRAVDLADETSGASFGEFPEGY